MPPIIPKKIVSILLIGMTLTLILSGCVELKTAYIPPEKLPEKWNENIVLRNTGTEFLGLEKWSSITYEKTGEETTSLTITTINTLVLTDETELLHYANSTIRTTFNPYTNLTLQKIGQRELANTHTSRYLIFSAVNNTENTTIYIIGEVWNCGISGVSVICIGLASIQYKSTPAENISSWRSLIGDPKGSINGIIQNNGLIYSIRCH